MDEVYRYIYDHGGKGVTVYRDGTRSKQVLTTRADNAEYAGMDEEEAAAAILENIDQAFGDIERFLDHEAVEERLGDAIDLLASGDGSAGADEAADIEYAEKQPRPDVLRGVTQRIDTGYGKVYITINEDAETGRPFELFANTGMSGGFTASFTEALAKSISVALRSGVDPSEIADKLRGIRSPKVAWDKGEQINSIPDAFGVALRRYLDDEIDRPYPRQQNLTEVGEGDDAAAGSSVEPEPEAEPETDGGGVGAETPAAAGASEDATQSLIDAGESPECPDCGSMSLYFSEGCKTCQACGWSEC
jgi:ribonucleoside-diphosphate reductase alpha chain